MKIIGLNAKETSFGKLLKDGALCIFEKNKPTVLVEERLSGIKHAGGFEASAKYANSHGLLNDVDLAVVSSCCEPQQDTYDEVSKQFKCNVVTINHHLSHAYQVFSAAGYEKALIVVADAGGNVLEEMPEEAKNWWNYKREQVSIFIGDGADIRLVGREFDEPQAIGFGEFWRYMTYACGFDSSTKAAKVMEIAAFGTSKCKNYFFEGGKSGILNNPPDKSLGLEIIKQCFGHELELNNFAQRANLAAWAQRCLEIGFIQMLERFSNKFQIDQVCIAGGVALNCKLIETIRSSGIFRSGVFSGYCPSDRGQALGNAIYGLKKITKTRSICSASPFLGPQRSFIRSELETVLGDKKNAYIYSSGFDSGAILNLIKKNSIIATCVGRSEVGARALGNTSLLATPNSDNIKIKLNKIKNRPDFTPLASALRVETSERIFGKKVFPNHQYMAELIYPEGPESKLPTAALHVDKSVRVQVIDDDTGGFLVSLLKYSANNPSKSDLQIILNTSFNLSGSPMPQTPIQATEQLMQMDIDGLLLDGGTLVRSKSALLESQIERYNSDAVTFFDIGEAFDRGKEIEKLCGALQFREKFSLFSNYIDWMKQGRKVTTIRYIDNGISVPASNELPLVMTLDFKQSSLISEDYRVRVYGVKIKKFRDLDQVDAQRDGFEKTSHLKRTLATIYPTMSPDSYVSINFIELVN